MSVSTFSLEGNRRLVAGLLSVLALATVAALLTVIVLPASGQPTHASPNDGSPGGCISDMGPRCTTMDPDASVIFGNVSSDGRLFTNADMQPCQSLTRLGNVTSQSVLVLTSVFDACGGVRVMGLKRPEMRSSVDVGHSLLFADTRSADGGHRFS
jgi:hypothetical protein